MSPRVQSKAARFAKAHRLLEPKPLQLQLSDSSSDGSRNANCIRFAVNDEGELWIDNWTFTPKDALRLAGWIRENFE